MTTATSNTPTTTTTQDTLPSLGQVAYEAYGDEPGPHGPWKTFDGRDMPRWSQLEGPVGALTRERWEVGVAAALAEDERRMVGTLELDSRQVLGADLGVALASARAVQASIGRGPGGQEMAHVITKLREATMWLEAALAAEPASLQAPSNLAHKPGV